MPVLPLVLRRRTASPLLENSFIHIPGVGEITEQALWRQGCTCWSDALDRLSDISFGTVSTVEAADYIKRSQDALQNGQHQFFKSTLGLKESWRAYPHFREQCCFLDIETDGGRSGKSVTTVGLHDSRGFRAFIRGIDLENFRDAISHYGMIVTFFGASFDLPMLEKRFKGIRFDQIHLDLCPVLRRVGLTGGLKKIEKQMGIARPEETEGLTGYEAILLWRKYERLNDQKALETLIAYNREDVVNLETLANHAYEVLKRRTFDELINPSATLDVEPPVTSNP